MKEAYRYKEQLISSGGYDVNGEYTPSPYGPTVTLILLTFQIISETPQGFWINTSGFNFRDFPDWKPDKKWCSKEGKSSFARLSKDEALQSYIARKNRQIKILKAQLRIAEAGKNKALQNDKVY